MGTLRLSEDGKTWLTGGRFIPDIPVGGFNIDHDDETEGDGLGRLNCRKCCQWRDDDAVDRLCEDCYDRV